MGNRRARRSVDLVHIHAHRYKRSRLHQFSLAKPDSNVEERDMKACTCTHTRTHTRVCMRARARVLTRTYRHRHLLGHLQSYCRDQYHLHRHKTYKGTPRQILCIAHMSTFIHPHHTLRHQGELRLWGGHSEGKQLTLVHNLDGRGKSTAFR